MDLEPSIAIFAGGGARGALHVGPACHICTTTRVTQGRGSSIGAFTKYAVTTGHHEELGDLWQEVRRQGDFMKKNLPFDGVHTLNPLIKWVGGLGWGVPKVPSYVGVFDWQTREHVFWSTHDVELAEALERMRASASIMVIHDRFERDGRFWGDGGHASPLPIVKYKRREWWNQYTGGVHLVLSVPTLDLPDLAPSEVNGPFKQLMAWMDYKNHESVIASVRWYRQLAKRISVPVLLYAPRDWKVAGPTFDSDAKDLREQIDRRIEHGAWMVENRRRLG